MSPSKKRRLLRAFHKTLSRNTLALKTVSRNALSLRRLGPVAGDWAGRARLWRRAAGGLGAVAAVSLAGNLLMYARFTPARPLVTIGGRAIPKRLYEAELDDAAGKPVLTKLVYAELIRQAAAKARVTPTPAAIDARLAEMGRRGAPPPANAARMRERVGLGLALENLRMQGIPATDAEVADFYRRNAAALALPAQVQSILVVTRSEFEVQTATHLLSQGKSASEMAAQPDTRVDGEDGFHLPLEALPPALHRRIVLTALAMRVGQILTLPLGADFLTIKCLHKDVPDHPALSQVRDEVARQVRLGKAPTDEAEMAALYRANPPRFDIDRYAVYLDGPAQPGAAQPGAAQPGPSAAKP